MLISKSKTMEIFTRIGRLVRVKNTQPKDVSHPVRAFANENSTYISVWVKDADGVNPRCLLFTDVEIHRAEARSLKNKEDHTRRSLISKLLD
jgi:hypothetical protein